MYLLQSFRGSRFSFALPTSSLFLINACMACSVAAAIGYRLLLEMLRRSNIAAVTCDSIVISTSNWTPRLRTLWVTLTKQSPTRKAYSFIIFTCRAEPNNVTSVFESFNFREFVFIHTLISATHCSMQSTDASKSSWRGFTVIWICVSSVYSVTSSCCSDWFSIMMLHK